MLPRSAVVVAAALAALVLGIPGGWGAGATPGPGSLPEPARAPAPTGLPWAHSSSPPATPVPEMGATGPGGGTGAWAVIRPAWNMTPAPGVVVPAARGLPVSAVPVEIAPELPSTTPTYLNLTRNLVDCCFQQNVSLPSGTWSRIVLNLTGWIQPSVYDSSYEMYIDQVPVVFGTTPEYGTWTVIEDLTEYSALLRGVANITFLLGAATLGGEFLTNLSLVFYPVPAGAHPPREPDQFIPLWYRAKFVPTRLAWWQTTAVPSDVVNATLELWAYGFGADEFWYNAAPPASPYRALTVSIDGRAIATEYPFEFINTGGIDLLMWRPVTGVQTTADRAQRFDVTADLGLLEGVHNWTLNMTGVSAGSDWIDDGVLALYTNTSVTGAHLVQYAAHLGGVSQRAAGNLTEVASTTNYTAESSIDWRNGTTNVTAETSEVFSMNSSAASRVVGGTTLGWSNVTGRALRVSSLTWAGFGGASGGSYRFDVPFEVHAGTLFVESRSTGGGYPIFGNATSYCDDVLQVWNETSRAFPAGGPASSTEFYDVLLGGNGRFTGAEELTGPNAALLLGLNQSSVVSNVPRTFELASGFGALAGSSTHRVVATATGPPPPDESASVVVDALSGTLAVGGVLPATFTDVGVASVLTSVVLGGVGPFQYTWSNLPNGCASSASADLLCRPAVSGNASVALRVNDSLGDSLSASVTELVVAVDPSVRVIADRPAVDAGGSVNFTARVEGGTGPFRCSWSVGETAVGGAQNCSTPFPEVAPGVGTVRVSVEVDDAVGVLNASPVASLSVVAPVAASVEAVGAPTATELNATAGSTAHLIVNVSGGVGPFAVTWYNDSGEVGTGLSLNLTVGPAGSTEGVYVAITDSGGGANQSATFVLYSISPFASRGAPNSNGPGFPTTLVLIGAGFGAVALVAVLLVLRRRAPSVR